MKRLLTWKSSLVLLLVATPTLGVFPGQAQTPCLKWEPLASFQDPRDVVAPFDCNTTGAEGTAGMMKNNKVYISHGNRSGGDSLFLSV